MPGRARLTLLSVCRPGEGALGYDVHITRKDAWYDEDGPRITPQEWADVVAADPELRMDGFAEAPLFDSDTLRTESAGIAVWTAHPGTTDGQAWIVLDDEGNVVVKNPDEAFRRNMWQIAETLRARVVGEDDEVYGSDGRAVQ